MEETRIKEKDLELLKEINKIKYWRKIRLIKLYIAVGLILVIAWFGWVNYVHANEYMEYQSQYGSLWSCYLCGYENLRSCNCIYNYGNTIKLTEEYLQELGNNNIKECLLKQDESSFNASLTGELFDSMIINSS